MEANGERQTEKWRMKQKQQKKSELIFSKIGGERDMSSTFNININLDCLLNFPFLSKHAYEGVKIKRIPADGDGDIFFQRLSFDVNVIDKKTKKKNVFRSKNNNK